MTVLCSRRRCIPPVTRPDLLLIDDGLMWCRPGGGWPRAGPFDGPGVSGAMAKAKRTLKRLEDDDYDFSRRKKTIVKVGRATGVARRPRKGPICGIPVDASPLYGPQVNQEGQQRVVEPPVRPTLSVPMEGTPKGPTQTGLQVDEEMPEVASACAWCRCHAHRLDGS